MWLMEMWAIQDARQSRWCGKGGQLDVEGALGEEHPPPAVSCGGKGAAGVGEQPWLLRTWVWAWWELVAEEGLRAGPVGCVLG